MTGIDFTMAVREQFEPTGYLGRESLQLRRVEQDGDVVFIEFESYAFARGTFGIRMTVPSEVGDDLWNAWEELTADIREWSMWGIAVPLLESYHTTALSTPPDSSGVTVLTVDGRIPD